MWVMGGGHNDAIADAKIFENYLRFYRYIRKNRWQTGLCPGPHSNCCLSLYLSIAAVQPGPGKMLLGSWKVLELFITQVSGNPVWLLLRREIVCRHAVLV